MFASLTTATLALPFDPGETVTIRKLTGLEIERAQAAHARGMAAGRGWANRFRAEIAKGIATDTQMREAIADPLLGYDRSTLLAGLTGWSYRDDGKPKPVTLEAKADLEDDPLEFIATAILRLTKPALFQTVADAEAARKND